MLWCYDVATALAFFNTWAFAPTLLAPVAAFETPRGTSHYLETGPIEFQCYDDVLIAYDVLLDEPRACLEHDAATEVGVPIHTVGHLFNMRAVRFKTGAGTIPDVQFTIPDPEEVHTGNANTNHPMAVLHVQDATVALTIFSGGGEIRAEAESEVETEAKTKTEVEIKAESGTPMPSCDG